MNENTFDVKNLYVTPITLVACKEFGPESLQWDPLILRDALKDLFNTEKLDQKTFDKVNCGYTLIGTNSFTESLESFLACTAIMNNQVFNELFASFCTFDMCAWSIWEYINLLGEINDSKPTETFSSDIIEYIREVGKLNGIYKYPIWMSFAENDMILPEDLSSDASQFEMFHARQTDNLNIVLKKVDIKQEELLLQLKILKTNNWL